MTTYIPPRGTRLPRREKQTLEGLARGRTGPQIAEDLGITPTTVHTTTLRLYARLGVHSAAQAVAVAYTRGILPDPPARQPAARALTPAQQRLLPGLAAGLSNEEIAASLGRSTYTVKTHLRRLLAALGATNRAHAVARAWQLRLLPAQAAQDRTAA